MPWNVDRTVPSPFGTIAQGAAGDGPPLILAHGWPWSSFSRHRIVPGLAARFRVHRYDMSGYGRSETPADRPMSLDVLGEAFAFLSRRLGLDRPRVVGHDLDGAVALRAYLLDGREHDRLRADERRSDAALGVGGVRSRRTACRRLRRPAAAHPPGGRPRLYRGRADGRAPGRRPGALCASWSTRAGQPSF
jgi:pimeloyl-ACP methyl ester carboxylesterase